MSSHRFTLFALKTFFMKALRHAPSLSTLHQRNGTPASSKNKSDIKEMDVSMPGQYHGGKGDGGKDDWEDAPGGDAGDEWEDDEHSAVHYPFEDWQEKCRIIPDIPLQFAWVSRAFSFSSDLNKLAQPLLLMPLRYCTSMAASLSIRLDVQSTLKYVLSLMNTLLSRLSC
jgi:hypothetical protein